MAADSAALLVGLALAFAVRNSFDAAPDFVMRRHVLLAIGAVPGFAAGAALTKLYLARANERASAEARNIFRSVGVGVGWMVFLAFALQMKDLSRLWVLLVAICVATSVQFERRLARSWFRRQRELGAMQRRILIVGTDAEAIRLLHMYQRNPQLGYRVVGLIGPDEIGQRAGVRVLGDVGDLDDVMAETNATGLVLSPGSLHPDDVNRITRRATDCGFHVAVSSGLNDIDVHRFRPQSVDGRTLMYIEPVIRGGWRAASKRVFDVIVASAILVVSAPLWAAAAIAIKLDTGGPVFFRQERVGRYGQGFTMTKFRTMVVDADQRKHELAELNESDGPLFKMAHDPRVTRVGSFLRKTSIDELPQLLSVLRGEMSMVGPRPALASEVSEWDAELRERLRVLPGLTGMWQVSGRSGTTFAEYRRLDLYYVDNWSLLHDIRICLRTVGVVLTGRGAL